MSRQFGTIQLDDNVHTFIESLTASVPRMVETVQIANRYGRLSRVKEDAKPVTINVRGTWADGGGSYWRDFQAAMYGQSRAPLTLGDGYRFEMCDCTEVAGTLVASSAAGTATPSQVWRYTAKIESYEPYAREVSPALQSAINLNNGNGTFQTTISVPCVGTAFSEPTWVVTLTIPSGGQVNSFQLQNSTSNESLTLTDPSGYFGAGSWVFLLDASGSSGVGADGTYSSPNNNGYALLPFPSVGWGVSAQLNGGAGTDYDFTGRVPTLVPSQSPSIPPASYANSLIATINGGGTLTTAQMQVLAPARVIGHP